MEISTLLSFLAHFAQTCLSFIHLLLTQIIPLLGVFLSSLLLGIYRFFTSPRLPNPPLRDREFHHTSQPHDCEYDDDSLDFHDNQQLHNHEDEDEDDDDDDDDERGQQYIDGFNTVRQEDALPVDDPLQNPAFAAYPERLNFGELPDIYKPSAPVLPADDFLYEYPSDLPASLDDVVRKPSAPGPADHDDIMYPSDLPASLDDVVRKASSEATTARPRTLPPSLSMVQRTLRESANRNEGTEGMGEVRKRTTSRRDQRGFEPESMGEGRKRTMGRDDESQQAIAGGTKSKGVKEVSNCIVAKLRKQFCED